MANPNKDDKSLKKNIDDVSIKTSNMLYGVSQDFINANNAEINKIKDTIKRITLKNNVVTGDNPIEFLTKMAYNDYKNNYGGKKKIEKDNKINLNSYLNGMTLGQINEIYAQELERISTYDDYDAIVKYIPQIAQGINVWKDNIISPDDFTKDIFNIIYDDERDQELKDKVEANILDVINPKYDIENKVDNWIHNVLVRGEEFVAVLKLEEEFDNLLKGNKLSEGEEIKILDESVQLNESSVIISENEISELTEAYISKKSSMDTEFDKEKFDRTSYESSIKNEIADILNKNIKFSTSACSLLEDELPIIEQFRREANKQKYSNYFDGKGEIPVSGDNYVGNKKSSKKDDIFVNGSYIKTLEPQRVIKIKVGEVVYGYFYIEVKGKNELIHPKNVYSALTLRQTVDLSTSDTSMIDDPKVRLITDLFAKNIGTKIDKKFISDNKEFKTVIYELLKKDYIYTNNIQITYFEPHTIKHLMIKENDDGYGISVLYDILFTAKLYLSVLITTLLTKISRSQDHRTYYIETGLSQDVEGIVNSFIRDVKTKDVKLSDTQSIDSIFTTIGASSDFFIPQVNGEKAIEMDITSGLNMDMDNDFMEYLKKTMISGMGIPSSMLQYADELEFARSVSMQNGMFLRSVIVKQKKLTTPFTSMYRDLYENEFGNSTLTLFDKIEKNKRDKKKNFNNKDNKMEEITVDINCIKVQFPSPSSLNATNLADQISVGQTIVQAIVDTIFNPNGENDEEHKFRFTQELYKKYVPNIDWGDIEDIYNTSKEEAVSKSLEAKLKGNSQQ